MNLLEIIYCIGAGALGTIIGVVIEYFIDIDIVKDIQDENKKLRMENEQLKQELQTRMENSGTTEAELAQYLGCSRKTVMSIKLGRTFPKLDQLVMIFDYFDKDWVQVPFYKEMDDYGN